jgi:hypothetical protein
MTAFGHELTVELYNLQGQRLNILQHGINIVGNQKKMVK